MHPVAILVFDGFQLLDLAGPADVMRAASLLGATPPYRPALLSPDGAPARADCGVPVAVDGAYADHSGRIGTLVVVGGIGVEDVCRDPKAVAAASSSAGSRTTSTRTSPSRPWPPGRG